MWPGLLVAVELLLFQTFGHKQWVSVSYFDILMTQISFHKTLRLKNNLDKVMVSGLEEFMEWVQVMIKKILT